MRKKYYAGVLLLALTAGIAGCGNAASSEAETVSEQTSLTLNQEESANTESSAGEEKSNESQETEDSNGNQESKENGASSQTAVPFTDESVSQMLPLLQSLMQSDYYVNQGYGSQNLDFICYAVYSLFNGDGVQMDRGIEITEDYQMRIPAQAVQEAVNAMYSGKSVDLAEEFQNGYTNNYLSYDPDWEAFFLLPADGNTVHCQIESWSDLNNQTAEVEICMVEGEGENVVTLGFADAVLVSNPDAAYIDGPLFPYAVDSFVSQINGRDVALGYPEEDGTIRGANSANSEVSEDAGAYSDETIGSENQAASEETVTYYGIFGGTIGKATVSVTVDGTEGVYLVENDSVLQKFFDFAPGDAILIDVRDENGELVVTDVIPG